MGEQYQVPMAFEPEVANVIHDAVPARRLLECLGCAEVDRGVIYRLEARGAVG